MRALSRLVIVLALGVLCGNAFAVELAKDGKPAAEIVIDAKAPDEILQFAGKELQLWTEKISGAKLPIVSDPDTSHRQIILGTPDTSEAIKAIEKTYAADLDKMKGNDGFAIRTEGNTVYIFARIPKGVLNGVFYLLELNSDIIFVQPRNAEDGSGTIFSKDPNFSAKNADCVVIPKFWYIRSLGNGNRLWQTRLRNLMIQKDTPQARKNMQHLGLVWSDYSPIIRQTMEGKEHPEFFAIRDGKPQEGWYTQLCYSNEELIKYYGQRIADALKSTPDDVFDIHTNHSDNNRVCQCEKCMKPITLDDGTVVEPSDPAFRSTAFFRFYNRAYDYALELLGGEKYPDKYIRCFAYLWSGEAPKLKLNDNIMAMFAPYVKSHKVSVYHESNQPWGGRAERWMAQHKSIYVYEYYLCSSSPRFYNPVADTAALDIRFYANGGVDGMYQDSGSGQEALDASGMEFWVISRLYWDPQQDLEALRDEFCRRAYRKAAKPMREYFKKIQKVWHEDTAAASWNDNPVMATRRYIVNNNLQQPLRKLLVEAEGLAEHPGSKELVQRHRAVFEKWLRMEAEATKQIELSVPYRAEVSMDNFDFDSGAWKDAAVIDDFRVRKSTKPAPLPTVVKVVNDRDNIYFAITCLQEDKELLKELKTMEKSNNWPRSPFIELFIDGDQRDSSGYYHLAFNALGSRWDAKNRDGNYSNNDWKVNGQINEDNWKIIMKWPILSFGRNITMNNRFGMMIYRNTGDSSWLGINVHEPGGFNDLILQMN